MASSSNKTLEDTSAGIEKMKIDDAEEKIIADFRAEIKKGGDLQKLAGLTTKLWNCYAAQLHNKNPISKLFESKTILPIFESVLKTAIALERLGKGLANTAVVVSSGSNVLISGVRGVGKTTLMKGFARVLSAACEHVFPVYWDYERMERKLPAQVILDELRTRVSPEIYEKAKSRETCIDLLNFLQAQRIYVLFFADEIQRLYVANAAENSREVRCVQELLSIGKESNCFGVVSGSSSNITTMAFKRNLDQQYHEYPNLNNTVYVERRLLPLRDEDEFKKLIQVRYPALVDDVENVFIRTGGVGRRIDELVENNDQSSIVNELCKPAFRAVINRLFLKNEVLKEGTKISWKQQSLSYAEVTSAMKPYISEAKYIMDQLNEWVDAGLLYNNKTNYELLLPSSYGTLKTYFEEYPDRLTLMALEGTLRQWDGSGSAGGLSEKYIIKRLFSCQHEYSLPFKILAYNQRCLSVTTKANQLPFKEVPNLCGELLSFAADQGFDGVVFEKGNNNALKVHAIQIKTGGINKRITPGGPSGQAEGKPDIILGIMKCANDAASSLTAHLKKANIQCTFASFTLVTNKVVTDDAKETFKGLKLNKTGNTHLIDKDHFYTMFTDEVLEELGLSNFIN